MFSFPWWNVMQRIPLRRLHIRPRINGVIILSGDWIGQMWSQIPSTAFSSNSHAFPILKKGNWDHMWRLIWCVVDRSIVEMLQSLLFREMVSGVQSWIAGKPTGPSLALTAPSLPCPQAQAQPYPNSIWTSIECRQRRKKPWACVLRPFQPAWPRMHD